MDLKRDRLLEDRERLKGRNLFIYKGLCYYLHKRECERLENILQSKSLSYLKCAPYSSPLFSLPSWPPIFKKIKKKKRLPLGFSSLLKEIKKMKLRSALKMDALTSLEWALLREVWRDFVFYGDVVYEDEDKLSIHAPLETFVFKTVELANKPYVERYGVGEAVLRYAPQSFLYINAAKSKEVAELLNLNKQSAVFKVGGFFDFYISAALSSSPEKKGKRIFALSGSREHLAKVVGSHKVFADEEWIKALFDCSPSGFIASLPSFPPDVFVASEEDLEERAREFGVRAEEIGKTSSSGYLLTDGKKVLVALENIPHIKKIKTRYKEGSPPSSFSSFVFENFVFSWVGGGMPEFEVALDLLVAKGGSIEQAAGFFAIFTPSKRIGNAIKNAASLYRFALKYRIPVCGFKVFLDDKKSGAVLLLTSPRIYPFSPPSPGDFVYVVDSRSKLRELFEKALIKCAFFSNHLSRAALDLAFSCGRGVEYEEREGTFLAVSSYPLFGEGVERIGRVRGDKRVIIKRDGDYIFNKSLEELKENALILEGEDV